ncbi:alpha/beta fold hydrolase [Aureimonas sp. OT7]|uniref:alpha/beta hydrolase n=1 Tax=Aureimonas sp. OT7 TaxID=2816454 RepID=UPI001FEF273C|nr:alpha/beta fold hydrolase [Aureimonas sp. OT7]
MLLYASMLALAAASMPSEDISINGPEGDLRGTWIRAADASAPVVLIIPGSGPTDRDGNSPLGIEAGTYRLLAEGLGQKGISTVRVDKRGIGASAGAVGDANAVTIEEYVSDTRAWVDDIRLRSETKCVWLLGHSEGGLVALATAQESPDICGLILVATAGRPMGDVVKTQLRAQPANAPLLPKADAAIDALAAGERVDADAVPPALAPLFAPAIQGFLISAFALDPADLAGRVEKPILIVQGDRDIQVGVPDAKALKEAAPTAELAVIPDVNHILKVVSSDDTAANIATYADPALPLAPRVIETIEDFLKRQPAADPL